MISVYVFRLCFLLADGNGCLTNNSQRIVARLVNASFMHTGIALYMITELKMMPLGDAVNMPAFSILLAPNFQSSFYLHFQFIIQKHFSRPSFCGTYIIDRFLLQGRVFLISSGMTIGRMGITRTIGI